MLQSTKTKRNEANGSAKQNSHGLLTVLYRAANKDSQNLTKLYES